MAIGDKAAAKGLTVYSASQAHNLGYQNDNQRGDDIADEIDARTTADGLKVDKANILVQATAPANIAGSGYSGRLWFKKA